MQSTKLLLLSILSQPPVPYQQSVVVDPPEVTIQTSTADFTWELFLGSLETPYEGQQLESGSTGTFLVRLTNTSNIPIRINAPQATPNVEYPLGWNSFYEQDQAAFFQVLEAGFSTLIQCEYVVVGEEGAAVEMQFAGNAQVVDIPVVTPSGLFVLTEDGGNVLQESGGTISLEAAGTEPPAELIADIPVTDGLVHLWDARNITEDGTVWRDYMGNHDITFNTNLSVGQELEVIPEGGSGRMVKQHLRAVSGTAGTDLGNVFFTHADEGGTMVVVGYHGRDYVGSSNFMEFDNLFGGSSLAGFNKGYSTFSVNVGNFGATFGQQFTDSSITADPTLSMYWAVRRSVAPLRVRGFLDGRPLYQKAVNAGPPAGFDKFLPVGGFTDTNLRIGLIAHYNRGLTWNEMRLIDQYIRSVWYGGVSQENITDPDVPPSTFETFTGNFSSQVESPSIVAYQNPELPYWIKLLPTQSSTIAIETVEFPSGSLNNVDFDTQIAVFNDRGEVVAHNDNFTGNKSRVNFFIEANRTYYLAVCNSGVVFRNDWTINRENPPPGGTYRSGIYIRIEPGF